MLIATKEQGYAEWLEREDFDLDFEGMDYDDIQEAIEDIWGKQGRDTYLSQSEALADTIRDQQPSGPPVQAPVPEGYYRHMGGNYYPRLASKGIKRVTYTSGGARFTRYSIPGSRGLYSLGSARKIFGNL